MRRGEREGERHGRVTPAPRPEVVETPAIGARALAMAGGGDQAQVSVGLQLTQVCWMLQTSLLS